VYAPENPWLVGLALVAAGTALRIYLSRGSEGFNPVYVVAMLALGLAALAAFIGLMTVLPPEVIGVLAAVLVGVMLVEMLHPRRRIRAEREVAGMCVECGYDLRESVERCPECGVPIPEDLARRRRIAADLAAEREAANRTSAQ
jgi:uncharacterized membrane protein YccC